ncbi:MAG: DinB family protein [Bacteroidetes bacterium]|nr:MAG: DinB family protein [Bacteroidota bacterium]
MAKEKLPEIWLRGPVENIPSLLQPVAHALLQAKEEVNELLKDFPNELLWEKPAGAASTGFHLQHLSGVVDRLFTYAQGRQLSEEQFTSLKLEGDSQQTKTTAAKLVEAFNVQVDKALKELEKIDERKLSEHRSVGRAQLPSTMMGCLFHAAEHTMRHVGQLIVTVRLVKNAKQ